LHSEHCHFRCLAAIAAANKISKVVGTKKRPGFLARPFIFYPRGFPIFNPKKLGVFWYNRNIIGGWGIPLIGDFNLAKIIGCGLFSSIGLAAFMYGKRTQSMRAMITGVALMAYPYFISSTVVIYLAGISLTAALYFWRD
jgi:hypothetical protein